MTREERFKVLTEQVTALRKKGKTISQIADELYLSERDVKALISEAR